MDKKKVDRVVKFIAAFLAFVLFGVAVFWSKDYDKGTDDAYTVVCLGDSNLGNVQDETGITALLGKKLGCSVLNGAFGGSTMANVEGTKTQYNSVLSMNNLAISICNKNFGMQKASIDAIARTDYVGYFPSTLENLSNVNFDKVEILIIEHGVNDYLNGTPIKNGSDPYDTDTFCGTLRTVISMLKENYPNLRIILSTPTYCAPIDTNGTYRYCDEYDYGGGILEDYVSAEIEVAEEMGVEVIDAYHTLQIDRDDLYFYLDDSLHLGAKGREFIANLWADYLLGEME